MKALNNILLKIQKWNDGLSESQQAFVILAIIVVVIGIEVVVIGF